MKNVIIAVLVVIVAVAGYFGFMKKSGPVAQQTPIPSLTTSPLKTVTSTPKDEMAGWSSFSSSYFTLSFKIPSGFEVKEAQNYILVAKSPYYTREIGDDNAFLRLARYNQVDTRQSKLDLYRGLLKNKKESTIIIDGSSFLKLTGDDWRRFEGDSAGKVTVVFFDASWVEIIEFPANARQDFDPIKIGDQILSTFRFAR